MLKTMLGAGLLTLAALVALAPGAAAEDGDSDGNSPACVLNVCWCVDTGATCGPYGDAWVWVEYNDPASSIRVCLTSNAAHVLC